MTARFRELRNSRGATLGVDQEAWLDEAFESLVATWNIIAQQTLIAQAYQVPTHHGKDGRLWNDGWDGYPAARSRLLGRLRQHRVANSVVVSGDVHNLFASELRRDFTRPGSNDNPVLATEFCGTSVTSNFRSQKRTALYVAHSPHMKYGRSDRRGYAMAELKPGYLKVRLQALGDVRLTAGISTIATFLVEDGKPALGSRDIPKRVLSRQKNARISGCVKSLCRW